MSRGDSISSAKDSFDISFSKVGDVKRAESVVVDFQHSALFYPVSVAHPTGFEPVIPSFVDWCLIQFGHGCVVGIMLKIRVKNNRLVFLEYSSPFVLK